MMGKLNRPLQIFNLSSLFVLALMLSVSIYFIWNYKIYDINKVEKLYQSLFMIEQLEKNEITHNIVELVKHKNPRAALKEYDKLIQTLDEIKLYYSGDLTVPFEKNMKESKELLSALVSYPTFNAITSVLDDKISIFYKFANENSWKTLLRMTERLKILTSDIVGHGYDRLVRTNRRINQDISIMKNVVNRSNLANDVKSSIMVKLNSMEIELNMLENYLRDWDKFNKSFNIFSKEFSKWPAGIQLHFNQLKENISNNAKLILFIPLAVLAITLVFLILGPIVFYKSNKVAHRKMEDIIFECISKGVVSPSFYLEEGFSRNFRIELEKAHHYVQKRISFSSLFQAAMPFPCILLDSNLKVIWANGHFCDSFNLKNFDSNKETLSWDFILRLTNITENDPVVEAIGQNVSGIYQIMVRVGHQSHSVPFEMYVTPVDSGKVKRVLLTFYPLVGLEETINNQGLSLVDPIRKSLHALISSQFDVDFQKSISKEFTSVGTEDIYIKFLELFELISTQKQGLLSEIDRLEDELRDYHKILNDIGEKNFELKKNNQGLVQNVNSAKNGLLSCMETNEHSSGIIMKYYGDIKDQIYKNTPIFGQFEILFERLQTFNQSITSLNGLKSDLKQSKNNIKSIISKMAQSLDQSLVFEKSSVNELLRLDQSLSKVRNDMKILENECKNLDKLITHFDVQLSKASMLMERPQNGNELVTLEQVEKLKVDYLGIDNSMKNTLESMKDFFHTNKRIEETIISPINAIYNSYKENNAVVADIEHIITIFTQDDINKNIQDHKEISM